MTSTIIDIVHKCLYTCLLLVFWDFEVPQSATFQAIGFIVVVGQITSTPYSRLTFKFDVWSKQTWSYYVNVWVMIFKIWPRDSSQTLPNWVHPTNECIPPHVRIIYLTSHFYTTLINFLEIDVGQLVEKNCCIHALILCDKIRIN